jgi:polar amino acid transport system substrate-binding protein
MNIKTVLLIILAVFTINAYAAEKKLNLSGASFPPFFGAEMENDGPLIEIVRAAFKHSNRKITISWIPWKRVILSAKNGKTDGITFAWHKPEREKFLHFGPAILPNETGLYYNSENSTSMNENNFDLQGLKDKKIGLVSGYAISNKLEATGAEFKTGNKDINLLQMLKKKRIDYLYTDKYVGMHLMTSLAGKMDTAMIKWAITIESFPNYLALSKAAIDDVTSKQIYAEYSKGLQMIRDSGEYNKILKRYNLIR